MKATNLIITSLFATTAWADSVKPWVFFARIKDTWVPLYDTIYDTEKVKVSVLSYGNASATPVEFNLEKEGVKTRDTLTPGYAGFYEDGLVFGPALSPTSFDFSDEMRIRNYPLYSCEKNSSIDRVIGYKNKDASCVKVDIHFLPYNRTSMLPEEGINLSEYGTYLPQSEGEHVPEQSHDEQKDSSPESADLPLVFAVKVNDIYKPLFGQIFNNRVFRDFNALSYRKQAVAPTEFTLEDGHAITNATPTPVYAGFFGDTFGFAKSIKKDDAEFTFDENMMVTNHPFFSCRNHFNTDQVIASSKLNSHCVPVEVYLLKYDRATESVVYQH